MDESFRSATSSPSFRVNPASELPRARATTDPSASTASWEYNAFHDARDSIMSSSTRSMADSEYSSMTHSRSNSTVKPMSPSKSRFARSSEHDTNTQISRPPTVLEKRGSDPLHPKVSKEEVWRDILLQSYGRDKVLKLIQYTIKVYLFFHVRTAYRLNKPLMGKSLIHRLKSTASGLSLARKCLILFNWLTPLIQITNPPPLPYASSPALSSSGSLPAKPSFLHRLLHASPPTLLELSNALADDTFTFSRLGLVPASIGKRADRIANILWFLSTLAGLVENSADLSVVNALMSDLEGRIYDVEMDTKIVGRGGTNKSGNLKKSAIDLAPAGQPNAVDLSVGVEEADEGLTKLRHQSKWLRVTRWKLLMDLIFVSYDVFNLQRYREPVQAMSGLMSAILSSSKVYDKQYTTLLKSAD